MLILRVSPGPSDPGQGGYSIVTGGCSGHLRRPNAIAAAINLGASATPRMIEVPLLTLEEAMRPCLLRRGLAAIVPLLLFHAAAAAQDVLKIAIGQRGGWEQCVSELGQNAGIFKKHGLALEVLYTQGSGETIQIVLSGSVDVGIGPGTHAVFGAFSKGAPIRMIGASFTGARDQLYYVRADSPVRGMKDAEGRTIAISTSGSSSHMLALALAKHFGISLVPQATGNYSATLTQVMTKQVDIGFAQAPFVLDAVEDGRIRLIARGADMPEVQNQSIRAWIAHANTLDRRRDALARYVTAYRETLDWLYSSPDALKAYAAWSGLSERLARQAPDFITKDSIDPIRIVGLEDMMVDAVKFKYIAQPLSRDQLATLVQVPR
jgi:NitT/TauT family transport system substrate-binding protein